MTGVNALATKSPEHVPRGERAGGLRPVRVRGLLTASLLVFAGAVCTESGFVVLPDPDPEPEPALPVSAVRTGAVGTGDTIRYLYEVPAGTAIRFFLRGTSGSVADSLVAAIRSAIGNVELGRVVSDGAAPDALTHGIVIGGFSTAARVVVHVQGLRSTDAGPFVLTSLPVDEGPEHVSRTLSVGVRIREFIDQPNDVDRFQVDVAAGQRVIMFIGKSGNASVTSLAVTAEDVNGAVVGSSTEVRTDHTIYERAIVLDSDVSTVFRLNISGPSGVWGGTSYELLPLVVPRTPESANAAIARGDTITEALDVLGDVDEFTHTVLASEDFRVEFALARDVAAPVELRVLRDGQIVSTLSTMTASTELSELGTPIIFANQPGSYTFRVSAPLIGRPATNLTPYQLTVIPLTRAPENADAAIVPGVEVTGESIDYAEDIDDFTLNITEGQYFSLQTIGEVRAYLVNPQNYPSEQLVDDEVLPGGIRTNSGFVQWTLSGAYKLRFLGRSAGVLPYQFTYALVDSAPETVAAVLPVNVWVSPEQLDIPMDRDEFRFTVPPAGGIVNVIVEPVDVFGAYASVTHTLPFITYSFSGMNGATGLSRQAGGTTGEINVHGVSWNADSTGPGTYRLMFALIDTTPESVPDALVLGDTVSAESIDPVGDIDEFRVTGPAGQPVYVWLEGPPPRAGCSGTAVFILDTFDGDTHLSQQWPGVPEDGRQLLLMPASGWMRLVVHSAANNSQRCHAGAYRIAVTAVP